MKGLFAIMDGKLGADKIRQEKWRESQAKKGKRPLTVYLTDEEIFFVHQVKKEHGLKNNSEAVSFILKG